jgi:lipid II:glycine glycyltransferase (peptidoglycan interpeptide bridge formation enzyme)
MAPYLLHWEIILDAKKQNLKEYNFLGVAPNEDQNHPWAGITRFKKQFGGYQADILGSFDLPLKPLEYKLFKFAEKIRRKS